MALYPYLVFSGTARQAMTRYQEILGGQLEIMGAGALPGGESPPSGAPADLVIHAALRFGDGDLLMASDDPNGDGSGMRGAALNLTLTDQAEARRIFEALAEGGSIDMPLGETFWSPLYGLCTDRFGVAWMVNVSSGT